MTGRARLLAILIFAARFLYAQSGDAAMADQYARWVQAEIEQGRWQSALTALERASDFSSASSDLSYLLALARSHAGQSRGAVLEAVMRSLHTGRWVYYTEEQARLLEAEQLVAIRNYTGALSALGRIPESADSAALRLLALRALALNSGSDQAWATAQFRRYTLEAIDRYPRDTRSRVIFLEYARNRLPFPHGEVSRLAQGDSDLVELILRQLPFLVESEAELAWMAAPFMRDIAQARRSVASYRAQNQSHINPASIPIALNLGVIDDFAAVEDLFSGRKVYDIRPGLTGGAGFNPDGEIAIDKHVVDLVSRFLRGDEGRDMMAARLHSFSGVIIEDPDMDGYADSCAFYRNGYLREYALDSDQDGIVNLRVVFNAGYPSTGEIPVHGAGDIAVVTWDTYPSVEKASLKSETFFFRPGEYLVSPVAIDEIGNSVKYSGLVYPRIQDPGFGISRRSLVSFSSRIQRPSVEFRDAIEQFEMGGGFPIRAVSTLNGRQVSVTEFESGFPVVQYIDLDLDGRMETMRRFRRPANYLNDLLDYRDLLYSSQSDWRGDGVYTTGELYLEDGSVVRSWDLEGSGSRDYSRPNSGN
jgi:hypothetical protein